MAGLDKEYSGYFVSLLVFIGTLSRYLGQTSTADVDLMLAECDPTRIFLLLLSHVF